MNGVRCDERSRSTIRSAGAEPETVSPPSGWAGIGATVVAATMGLNVLSLALPIVVLQIYDRVLPNASLYTLFWFTIGFAVVTLLEALLRWSRAYIVGWSGVRCQHALLLDATRHVLDSELAAFEQDSPGTHVNRLQAIDQIAGFVGGEARLVVVDLCFVPLFLFVFWTIAGSLVSVPIALLAVTAAVAFGIGRLLLRSYAERAEAEDRRSSFVLEVLKGLEAIKLLGMEPLMLRRYERLRDRAAANAYRTIFLSNMAQQVGGVVSNLSMAFVAVFGAKLVIDQSLSIGGLAACMMLASRAIQPPLRGFSLLSQFQIIAVAKQRVREIFQLPAPGGAPAQEVGPQEVGPQEVGPQEEGDAVAGGIELRDLSFSYDGCATPLLAGVNLTVAPGEFVAISGASGAGKSTLLLLMRGLLQPGGGEILIDGCDIRRQRPEDLRRHMVLLTQRHVLFRGTILDNLTLFRPDRVDKALKAAEMLGLDKVISLLPEGYDSEIRDASDIGLAEGVRQGVALARAFADDYRIILFDEASSCLDARIDHGLIAALARIKGTVSVVMVTRSPALLALADRVHELRDGSLTPTTIRAGLQTAMPGAPRRRAGSAR